MRLSRLIAKTRTGCFSTPKQEPQNRAKYRYRKNDEGPNDSTASGMSPIARNAHERRNEQDCVQEQQESHDAPVRHQWIYVRCRERQYHFFPKIVRLLMLNHIASSWHHLEITTAQQPWRPAALSSSPASVSGLLKRALEASASRSITVPKKRAATSRLVTGPDHVGKTRTMKCTMMGGLLQPCLLWLE